ncbi:MAG TPA: glycosyltransferase family 4 protein [Firmicutes bacterium]|nr:glycosyltransferase family 4 protein [Bacillota bacterium]
MRVLMLSWEYPPKVIGGIAPHVHDLSIALCRRGQEVHVLTVGTAESGEEEYEKGVTVHRCKMDNPEPPDFISWTLQLNLNLVEKVMGLAKQGETFDLIHAHDWLVAYAGKLLKHVWRIPMLATIHATEWGRNNGLHNETQRYISNIEWWLGYEAWRVICCSRYMFAELRRIFQLPEDKIRIIPNGVFPEAFRSLSVNPQEIRNRYAAPHEKIVFYVGRLVFEKGLDLLLEAAVKVLSRVNDVKFVIAGKGPYEAHLKEKARRLGIYERIYFTGYIDDQIRNALFNTASVAVFPSIYEPFGIVALEAMAAGTPVVVTDTGGLGEVVHHGRNGLKAFSNSPDSLADNIIWMITHPGQAQEMKRQAWSEVETVYSWDKIAEETINVYEEVRAEYENSDWRSQAELEWKATGQNSAWINTERKSLTTSRYTYDQRNTRLEQRNTYHSEKEALN